MSEMQLYIGTKIIKAIRDDQPRTDGLPPTQGYKVIYPDGYESWSPKKVFEQAYRRLSNEEKEMF